MLRRVAAAVSHWILKRLTFRRPVAAQNVRSTVVQALYSADPGTLYRIVRLQKYTADLASFDYFKNRKLNTYLGIHWSADLGTFRKNLGKCSDGDSSRKSNQIESSISGMHLGPVWSKIWTRKRGHGLRPQTLLLGADEGRDHIVIKILSKSCHRTTQW